MLANCTELLDGLSLILQILPLMPNTLETDSYDMNNLYFRLIIQQVFGKNLLISALILLMGFSGLSIFVTLG